MKAQGSRRESRTVLVTGAATGIGLAVARAMADRGWRVLGTAMPDQDASSLLLLPRTAILRVDLASPSSLDDLVRSVLGEPRLDLLVSNAGIALPGPMEATRAADLRRQFEVNAIAPLLLASALAPKLRTSRGKIVFIGAGQGRVALPFGGGYGASKAALASLADALRAELSDTGIAVSVIEPGSVATGIFHESRHTAMKVLDGMTPELSARYRAPLEAVLAKSARAMASALPASRIGDLVADIADSAAPKPRYLIGRDAWALASIAVVPARVRAAVVQRMMRSTGGADQR